jgi:hypothetical protein
LDYSVVGLLDGLTFEIHFFMVNLLAPTAAASFCKPKDIADGGKMNN